MFRAAAALITLRKNILSSEGVASAGSCLKRQGKLGGTGNVVFLLFEPIIPARLLIEKRQYSEYTNCGYDKSVQKSGALIGKR